MSNGSNSVHPLPLFTLSGSDGTRTYHTWDTYGLTKREYFAGQALAAIPTTYFNHQANPANAAAAAVALADALLEALEK